MMAKMFYKLAEAMSVLGKNEEEIKQLTREGRLREFRDGPSLMYKVDQVEALKQELGLGGGAPSPDLGPSDSGGPIGLVDSRGGGSATGISLVDSDMGSMPGSSGSMQLKDDTALAGDLGMSGSLGGVPSPGRPGSSSGTLSGSRGGSGINVLGDTSSGADPSAQTAISSGGSFADQVSLEGVGSGSGLLDLTRESDDTSLGAELLDEIAPGGTKRGTKAGGSGLAGSVAGSAAGTAAGGTAVGTAAVGRRAGAVPVFVEAADATAPAFGGAALGAALVVIFGGFALTCAVMDTTPDVLKSAIKFSPMILLAISFGVAVIFGVVGAVLGKAIK